MIEDKENKQRPRKSDVDNVLDFHLSFHSFFSKRRSRLLFTYLAFVHLVAPTARVS